LRIGMTTLSERRTLYHGIQELVKHFLVSSQKNLFGQVSNKPP
jgi:hypothetical protein